MANDDYKEGWGVVDRNGLNIRTVSPTRRAAIVNWLVVEAGCAILASHTDGHINALWDAHRGEALIKPIRMYVQ